MATITKIARIIGAFILVGILAGCDLDGESDNAGSASSVTVSSTAPKPVEDDDRNPAPDTDAEDVEGDATFAPPDDPEVVFRGPLEESQGSLVIRYEPNSWYRESGIAGLPSVGELQWFLNSEEGCRVVDRSMFIEATPLGQEVTMVPASGGEISIGESIPLWIEGDWLVHDGCVTGDPILQGNR